MGIDLSTYRARIGCFSNPGHDSLHCWAEASCLLVWMVISQLMLKLAGDVEENPGPKQRNSSTINMSASPTDKLKQDLEERNIISKDELFTSNMSDQSLKQLPGEVPQLDKLKVLNRLIMLPKEVSELTKIDGLELSRCQLYTLPPEVGRLQQLERLDLSHNPLDTLPGEIGQLTNMKHLDLSDCWLNTLPPELGRLTKLQWLDLRSNPLQTLPKDFGHLTTITHLDLSECKLKILSPEVWRLTQLKWLDLRANPLKTLPADVGQLTNLEHLNLTDCQLSTLPSEIERLVQLEYLHLTWNPLQSLPNEFEQLRSVKLLDLSYCQLTILQTEVWMVNKQVEWLNLMSNPLQLLSERIGQLTNIRHLDLSNCRLCTLPPEVGGLAKLEHLNLSHNPRLRLPAKLGELVNIIDLDLSGCHLGKLPHEVLNLTRLERLNLENTHLSAIPRIIDQLTRINDLNLRNNQLTALPEGISSMAEMKKLSVARNKLTHLPDSMCLLPNIEHFDASRNNIVVLPAKFGQLTNLSYLDVSKNPLSKPPDEVCRQGIIAIKQYFDEVERSEENTSARLKLVVLGETMAGKTSLVQTLRSGISTLTRQEDRTHCVEITQWTPDDSITFEVYDFGGHDVYHLTHQFFLTPDAFYLLLVNLHYRCNKQSYERAAGFWLDTLNACVPGAVVCLVGSKTDLCTKDDVERKTRDIWRRVTMQRDVWKSNLDKMMTRLIGMHERNRSMNDISRQLAITRRLSTQRLRIIDNVQCVQVKPRSRLLRKIIPKSSLSWFKLRSFLLETARKTEFFPRLKRTLPRTWVDFEEQLRNVGSIDKSEQTTGSDRLFDESSSSEDESQAFVELDLVDSDDGETGFPDIDRDRSEYSSDSEFESLDFISLKSDDCDDYGTTFQPLANQQSNQTNQIETNNDDDDDDESNQYSLTLAECEHFGRLSGLSSDRLEPVLSYLQQVGTILRYTDIPELRDFVFHDPPALIEIFKDLFHHDINTLLSTTNPKLGMFTFSQLTAFQSDLRDRALMPKEVVKCLLPPNIQPNVDVVTKLMQNFGLCSEIKDEEEPAYHEKSTSQYKIPWYLQNEMPTELTNVWSSQVPEEQEQLELLCNIKGFCPRGLFQRFSVGIHPLVKDRIDWKNGVMAYRHKYCILACSKPLADDTYITMATRGKPDQADVMWGVVHPLLKVLVQLLQEWPGVLYSLHVTCAHCIKARLDKPHQYDLRDRRTNDDNEVRCPLVKFMAAVPTELVHRPAEVSLTITTDSSQIQYSNGSDEPKPKAVKVKDDTCDDNHRRLEAHVYGSGLTFRAEVPKDGNCMFHAVCDQILRTEGRHIDHLELRQQAVNHMKKNPRNVRGDNLAHYISNQSWEEYLETMSRDGTWGDHVVLQAMADMLGRDISIVSSVVADNYVTVLHPQSVVPSRAAGPLLLGHDCAENHYASLDDVSRYFHFIKESVAADWKDLAYQLGFNRADVETIDERNKDYKSRCLDLLHEWQKGERKAVTITVLMAALQELELMDVVNGLESKFPELIGMAVKQGTA